MKFLLPTALALIFWSPPGPEVRHPELEVRISGIEELRGVVVVALVDSPEGFRGESPPRATARLPADAETLVWRVGPLPEGEYALKAFQDLDGDGELTKGAFGVPQEPYAFSNGARGKLGPPSWAAARFELTMKNQHVVLNFHG